MENSLDNKKAEISFLLKECKEFISLHSDEVAEYLKNEYSFEGIENKLNDNDYDDFESLKFEYYDLAKEFKNFVMK